MAEPDNNRPQVARNGSPKDDKAPAYLLRRLGGIAYHRALERLLKLKPSWAAEPLPVAPRA
jgi:hypothetical protein